MEDEQTEQELLTQAVAGDRASLKPQGFPHRVQSGHAWPCRQLRRSSVPAGASVAQMSTAAAILVRAIAKRVGVIYRVS
jgi:hypothetical protein